MKLIKLIFLVAIGISSLSVFADKEDILIKNATVITSSDQGVLNETDVLIKEGIITSIGKNIDS